MKKRHIILLVVIIALASFLRFYNLDSKGLFFHDEGAYLLEAEFIVSGISFLAGNFTKIVNHEISLDNYFKGDEIDLKGYPPTTAKAGHNIFTALSMFIFQDRVFAGLFVSALFGVLTVILVFFMGKKMFNLRVAFFSSLVLAVSGYHVFYSRTAYAETDSIFFFILAVYFYYLSKISKKRNNFLLIIAGLSCGYAVLSNYSRFILLAIFFFYELFYFKFVRLKDKMIITGNPGKTGLFFIALAVPLIGCQFIYHIINSVLPKSIKLIPYFDQVFMRMFRYHPWINFKDVFFYCRFIYKLDGIAMLILIILGCFLMIRNIIGDLRQLSLKESIYKKKTLYIGGSFIEKYIVIITFLLLFVLWSIYSHEVRFPRTIVIIVPLYALIAGWTIDQLFCLIKNRKIFGILGIISVIFFMFLHSYENLYLNSGYKKAMGFFKNKANKKHISTFWPISQFYVGRKNVAMHLWGMDNLKRLYLDGYRYIVFDWMKYTWLGGYERIKSIEENFKPVFVVDNMIGNNEIILCDNGYTSEFVRKHKNDKDLGLIKIYDLQEIFK